MTGKVLVPDDASKVSTLTKTQSRKVLTTWCRHRETYMRIATLYRTNKHVKQSVLRYEETYLPGSTCEAILRSFLGKRRASAFDKRHGHSRER